MNITSGKILRAQKICTYGPEGIGKTTFASQFPNPLFIDTEGGTSHIDVKRLDTPTSWSFLLEQVKWVKGNPTCCDTLVIDTADWAEKMCSEHVCSSRGVKSIEDFGYGKGYIYLKEEFGQFLNLLSDLIEMGINVLMTAHAQMRKFEQPDELGSYDRWELKLSKQCSPLLKEWADLILFANYETIVVNVDGQGAQKGKNKVQGGKRVMHTSHHPCWDAKNRHGLAEKLPFDFAQIAGCIPVRAPQPQPQIAPAPDVPTACQEVAEPETVQVIEQAATAQVAPSTFVPDEPDYIKQLRQLMASSNVSDAQLQDACAFKRYVTAETPIEKYPADFVLHIVSNWAGLAQTVEDRKPHTDPLPFN